MRPHKINSIVFVQAASLVVFMLCLILPGVQLKFGIVEEERLHGVEASTPTLMPSFSMQGFADESFQRHFDRWFQDHIGFRGHFIRTDNQLNLSLFSEMSSNYGSPLVLGSQNTLFEKLYQDDFNQENRISGAKVDALAEKIARAAKLLNARGVPLLIMLSPSKTTVYREDIPRRYIDERVDRSNSNYDLLGSALRKHGVPFFDGVAFTLQLKATSPYRVFPKSGTHWSQHTSCLVVEQLTARLATLLQKQLHSPRCNPPELRQIPEPFDRDLADLSNIWNVSRFFTELPYPPPQQPASEHPELYQPRLIFIGGSFLWTIFRSFEQSEIYSERTLLYYFKRAFHFPSGSSNPISAKQYNWQQQLPGIDAVVLEINEANIHQAGGGSIGDIIRDLSPPRRRTRPMKKPPRS